MFLNICLYYLPETGDIVVNTKGSTGFLLKTGSVDTSLKTGLGKVLIKTGFWKSKLPIWSWNSGLPLPEPPLNTVGWRLGSGGRRLKSGARRLGSGGRILGCRNLGLRDCFVFKNPFLESNLSCYFDWRVLIIYEYFEKYIVGLLNSLLSHSSSR